LVSLPYDFAMTMEEDGWRLTHLGRLLGHAMRRFDERVLHESPLKPTSSDR
jgi:hypothetical protein